MWRYGPVRHALRIWLSSPYIFPAKPLLEISIFNWEGHIQAYTYRDSTATINLAAISSFQYLKCQSPVGLPRNSNPQYRYRLDLLRIQTSACFPKLIIVCHQNLLPLSKLPSRSVPRRMFRTSCLSIPQAIFTDLKHAWNITMRQVWNQHHLLLLFGMARQVSPKIQILWYQWYWSWYTFKGKSCGCRTSQCNKCKTPKKFLASCVSHSKGRPKI